MKSNRQIIHLIKINISCSWMMLLFNKIRHVKIIISLMCYKFLRFFSNTTNLIIHLKILSFRLCNIILIIHIIIITIVIKLIFSTAQSLNLSNNEFAYYVLSHKSIFRRWLELFQKNDILM